MSLTFQFKKLEKLELYLTNLEDFSNTVKEISINFWKSSLYFKLKNYLQVQLLIFYA